MTKKNLAQSGLFITRLPATYNECERSILAAVGARLAIEHELSSRVAEKAQEIARRRQVGRLLRAVDITVGRPVA